jgi:hypothetical protein
LLIGRTNKLQSENKEIFLALVHTLIFFLISLTDVDIGLKILFVVLSVHFTTWIAYDSFEKATTITVNMMIIFFISFFVYNYAMALYGAAGGFKSEIGKQIANALFYVVVFISSFLTLEMEKHPEYFYD